MNDRFEGFSRRGLLGTGISAAVTASTGFGSAFAASQRRKPNFIFILADDMGAFDLSCYGRTDYTTPHIDSLAQEGMKFNFGYANSSSCAPTRVALFSGRYQNRLPIGTGEGGGYPSATLGYPASLPSLASVLKSAGYRTALVGKWDLGELPGFGPNKSGYDEFFGLMGGGISYSTHDLGKFWTHAPDKATDPDGRDPDLYENERPVDVEGYATDLFTDRACDFIKRNARQPFLLSLHYNAPHWPWETRSDRGLPRMSDAHFDGGSPAIYGEMVRAMDDGVGRVLALLRRLDLSRDTVIVFTSDNGGERFSKMWPLRGAKGDLWEGGTRVPLLVSWPGAIKRGSRSNQVAMSMDFLPTFASLAGAFTNPTLPSDGIDLSPQLFGAKPVDRVVYWKTPGEMLSALAYPWKYLKIEKREFLYNLAEDETEHANYKRRNAAMFADLKAKAEVFFSSMLESMRGLPPAVLQSLEALDPVKLP
ncbi:arylsulfatase A-like enzyme [Sphingobium xenophagum]|uniref:Arylsulfatase A-like enzyme n=1 Tax=Sphingobium xenophagum TaxID=121428 RepID=A0ABU1X2B1_SPHXE|nr:sulfatase-like hydrolase/transferase [Sphingobium xenophagum]MDR7155704.1 arylsulfatase A-like enzyme [Sphingobium xenophagum]